MKPLIGITPSLSIDELAHGTFERCILSSNYPNAVLAAGGIPVIIPPQRGNASELVDRIDGLLFSGGADIDPSVFGDTDVHPKTYGISHLRDDFEFELLKEALRRDVPILCICRGIQVLNVALGGTLYQDVPDQFESEISHRQQDIGIDASESSHDVDAAPGSLLSQVYESTRIQTNSFHHQAIKALAPELVAEGRSPDGLIEAVSLPGRSFVLGVQWHPEMMFEHHAEHRQPFRQLVSKSASRELVGSTR
jgi:putative glutamine amidotransferase